MGKTKITLGGEGGITYFRPKDLEIDQMITGTYLGTVTDSFSNTGHKLRLTDGSTGVINGAGKLNALLELVSVGSAIEVVYKGKSTIESGKWKGKAAHDFDVFVDDAAVSADSAPKSVLPFSE